jgi:cell division protein FtsN
MPLPTQHTLKAQQLKVSERTAKKIEPLAVKNAPSAPASKTQSTGKYIVLAGSYSSETNAKNLGKKLAAGGLKNRVSVDKLEIKGKPWWRVNAGPFASKEEAEKAVSVARSAGAADARVTSHH